MLATSVVKKPSGSYDNGWTRDHLVPRSKGGKNGYSNIVLAHIHCNGKRSNSDPTPDMMVRRTQLWQEIRTLTRGQVRLLIQNRALRSTYVAAMDWSELKNVS